MILDLVSLHPDQTIQIGKSLGAQLSGDELVLLSGDLGAGKTLLTKGIAMSLGIPADEVVSPTFSILNQLEGNGVTLFHIDLYRIGNGIGGYFPEIDDHLGEGVVVVEWAQYLPDAYFSLERLIHIAINNAGENRRTLHVETSLDLSGDLLPADQSK